MMRLRPYMMLQIFLLFALAPAYAVAAGQVNGSVLYGAGQYRAEVDGKETQKISSQYGQVSLNYRAQNWNQRLGKYSLLLGYEFNTLAPSYTDNGIKDQTVERIETGKILYRGEVLLAPGGMPFRFNAYARDTNRSSFTTGSRLPDLPLGMQGGKRQSQYQTTLLTPDIMTQIQNGSHNEVGATLLIGIRNGSYLGNYRDILSQLPRFLIDYRQIEVTDLAHDSNQQHYRNRDLAFVSLNKKDNWVHFRTRDFKDYIDPSEDYLKRQVLIGTIDQLLTRQWINMTNWMKISGDISYTVDKRKNEEFAENTYRVNLLATTKRQEFNSAVLSNFKRMTQGGQLEQDYDLPLYFNYEPNRDSYYRGNLRTIFSRQSFLAGSSPSNNQGDYSRRDFYIDLGSEFFRTRAVVFKPRIMLGVRGNDEAQGVNEKLVLEWSSPRDKNTLPWTAGYDIASTQTSTDTSSFVYLEQSLYGRVEKDLSRALRTGLRATVRHGRGQLDSAVSSGSNRVEIGASKSGVNKEDVDSFLFYDGQFFGEHAGRLFSNRIELNAEGIKADADRLTSTEVRHELKMAGQAHRFSLSSSLSRGSQVIVEAINTEYALEKNTQTQSGYGWTSRAKYNYEPDRRLRLTLQGSIKGLSGGDENYNAWIGSERLEYHFYKSNGIVRKIAEISEEFGTEGTTSKATDRNRTFSLRMLAAVYPTKYIYAKVISELVAFRPSGSEQMKLNVETGANFQKFQVALSYGRGYKTTEGLLAEVKEERWDVKVKKIF